MCTYNFSLSDAAINRIRPAFKDDAAIHAWMLKQLETAIMQFQVTVPEKKLTVSQRLRGIAKDVPSDFDYKKELENRL